MQRYRAGEAHERKSGEIDDRSTEGWGNRKENVSRRTHRERKVR